MEVYNRDGSKKRRIIIGSQLFASRMEDFFKNNDIYVRHPHKEKRVYAYSFEDFETPRDSEPLSRNRVIRDSNFIDGEEVMSCDNFIEVLEVLNKARVIDETKQLPVFFYL